MLVGGGEYGSTGSRNLGELWRRFVRPARGCVRTNRRPQVAFPRVHSPRGVAARRGNAVVYLVPAASRPVCVTRVRVA